MNGATLAAALLAGLLTVSATQAQTPEAVEFALEARILNEGYEPAVDVSGRTLMGVMAEPSGHPDGDDQTQRLYLWLPDGLDIQGHRICISLNSRDGHYTSLLDVSLERLVARRSGLEEREAENTEAMPVDFVTRKPEYYTQYDQTPPPHRLAVLAELKSDCSPATPREAVLVAAWRSFSAPQTLSVLANSSRLETLLAVLVEAPEGERRQLGVMCQPIEAPQRIAYDAACRLDIARLRREGDPLIKETLLVRRRGSSLASQVPVELAL
ncbi:hypothetical protein ACGTN6_20265 [Halomonas sp. THAF12]|uniref:hypothetical protein n=1 Tax=Halomonas sp. B23F22_10 TaxID=3459515 RepID=UPI00373E46AA